MTDLRYLSPLRIKLSPVSHMSLEHLHISLDKFEGFDAYIQTTSRVKPYSYHWGLKDFYPAEKQYFFGDTPGVMNLHEFLEEFARRYNPTALKIYQSIKESTTKTKRQRRRNRRRNKLWRYALLSGGARYKDS